LSLAYDVDGTRMEISVCVGIATGHPQPGGWEGLLASADAALYVAKAAGKGQIAFHADNADAVGRE
jgi:PleD family two-component response regulator